MVTTTQMYWITRLDAIEAMGIAMTLLGLFVTVVTTAFYLCFFNEIAENVRRMLRNILRVSVPVLAIGIAIGIFVPNTKEMAAILVVPRIANSESVSDIADGAKTLAVEWLEELRPGKDGK